MPQNSHELIISNNSLGKYLSKIGQVLQLTREVLRLSYLAWVPLHRVHPGVSSLAYPVYLACRKQQLQFVRLVIVSAFLASLAFLLKTTQRCLFQSPKSNCKRSHLNQKILANGTHLRVVVITNKLHLKVMVRVLNSTMWSSQGSHF